MQMLEVVAVNALRLIESAGLGSSEKAVLRCELAKELEEVGNYEGGREALGGLWRGVGGRPKALVLLRAGTSTGWLGAARQIPGAQEAAKDLIGESLREFEALGLTPLALEARAELALCYWREGAFDE